jgi:hypothetical protein
MASGMCGYDRIEYRLDNDKARTVTGTASKDNKSLGHGAELGDPCFQANAREERNDRPLIPYCETPFTATFKVAGLEKVTKPLGTACG